jgi:hypothetical protein
MIGGPVSAVELAPTVRRTSCVTGPPSNPLHWSCSSPRPRSPAAAGRGAGPRAVPTGRQRPLPLAAPAAQQAAPAVQRPAWAAQRPGPAAHRPVPVARPPTAPVRPHRRLPTQRRAPRSRSPSSHASSAPPRWSCRSRASWLRRPRGSARRPSPSVAASARRRRPTPTPTRYRRRAARTAPAPRRGLPPRRARPPRRAPGRASRSWSCACRSRTSIARSPSSPARQAWARS